LQAIPHLITLFRLVSAPVAAWLLVKSQFQAALLLVLLAGVSDWLDGFAARKLKVSGHLGVVFDPLADKVMLVILFVTLGLLEIIPLWMLWLAVLRDVVIVVGALLVRTFRGIRKFVPSRVGKVSTFFQIMLVLLALIYSAYPDLILLWLKNLALALTAVFTTLSGIDYVYLGIQMARRKVRAEDA
jgi:cardiolipin synthase (CMP-forming)